MLEIDLSKDPVVKIKLLDSDIEFESKVLEHEKDRVFLQIKNPKKEDFLLLKEGSEVELTICSSSRIVKMKSLIIEYSYAKDSLCVELNQEYDVIQRRRYVRTKASYFVELKSPQLMFKAQTINLGGGGLCFIGNHCFEIGQTFQFRLLLPNYDDIIGEGIVINKVETQDETLIMFNFSDIKKETRNKIIRFCFEKEFNA